jgi:DnaJ-class molecular chaperone
MATDDDDRPAAGEQTCTPCRGTGRLISGLGGTPHEVTCPWCEGTGHRIPGLNAQEHPAEGGGAEPTS